MEINGLKVDKPEATARLVDLPAMQAGISELRQRHVRSAGVFLAYLIACRDAANEVRRGMGDALYGHSIQQTEQFIWHREAA